MRVRDSTGLGILVGIGVGAIALGFIKVEAELRTAAQTWAWWIVVLTTLLPLTSYLKDRLILKGSLGGFLSGLGTGLGFFLLLVGKGT
jgi:hypothetical protein